jgi:oxalate decarboxylase/phosphoglucose isomerase-like protein (cupin superfamily)
MKRKHIRFGKGFKVVLGNRRVQAVYPLRAGTLMLIEHGDRHEIRNTGRQLLKTLNLYSPPGYTAAGDELPAAKPAEG